MRLRKYIFTNLACFLLASCGSRDESKVNSMNNPINIKFETDGADTYLYLAVIKPVTSMTLNLVTASGTQNIPLADHEKLPNGRHIFKTQTPFVMLPNMEYQAQAVADAQYTRRFMFEQNVPDTANVPSSTVTPDTPGIAIPKKHISSKPNLSEYGLKYIEMMNKLDYMSNGDPVAFKQYCDSLKGQTHTFDLYFFDFSGSSPNYKSLTLVPITKEGEKAIAENWRHETEYRVTLQINEVEKFQEITNKFKDAKPGIMVRAKVLIKAVHNIGTDTWANLLDIEILNN